MLGLAITVVVCLSLVLVGLTPLADRISPIGRLGLFGLFGLGTYGLALGVEGLIGTLTGWGGPAALIAFVVVLGCNLAFPDRATSKIGPLLGPHSLLDLFRAPRLPRGMEWAFAIPIGLALLFALVGVLAPSTAIDWDSLAYHLAVPKLWLESGFRPAAVPFIHHSSFPAGFDSLFILGLSWGGETGAKAFVWMSLVFGVLAVMGVARDLYGRKAAWWAGLAFATVPLVIWESGTAYIDVPHGLCAGLGILFAARLAAEPTRRDWLWMSGLCLGFAASSKYTGLQTILAVAATLVLLSLIPQRKPKSPSPYPLPSREGWPDRPSQGTAAQAVPDRTSLGTARAEAWEAGGGSRADFEAASGSPSPNPLPSREGWKLGIRNALFVSLIALAIASPWYIRNQIERGNPVFPFFYSKLGGKGWDQRRADIYSNEQNTFGVARAATAEQPDLAKNPIQPARIGHAILGLAYQPGRYVNPGQTSGQGTPLGAIGVPVLAALFCWLLSGRARRFEAGVLGACLISLAMWFALSEQSRYVMALVPALAVLLGGAVVRLRVGPLLAGITALQAAYSLWLVNASLISLQLPVVLGAVPADEFRARMIPFFLPSREINKLGAQAKVALYDEVFGYLLDVPYVWANPGHSTIIPYDDLADGHQYADAMRRLGFTHVYVNVRPIGTPPERAARWLRAAGLAGQAQPYSAEERTALMESFEQRWKALTAEAAASGEMRPVYVQRPGEGARAVLFELKQG